MLSDKPKNARVLFVDMNSFFARVEQQVQPIYRGKPVGVAPYTGNTGCLIAASYEAKAQGLKTGHRVGEAKKECPDLIILPSRPALYMFYHKEIIKAAESFSPFLKVYSIDEFSIKLTGSDQSSTKARQMAFGIKDKILEDVGDWLTCSIGIGPNRFLAKMAAEFKKPDGFFEITLENLESIYQKWELRDLTGINYGIERQLHAKKVYTPMDLYRKSLPELSKILGVLGKVWYYRLRGYEIEELNSPTKSIGHSHVLEPELRTYQGARQVLLKLVDKTGYRLRQAQLSTTQITLYIKFLDGERYHKNRKISPTKDGLNLAKFFSELYYQIPKNKKCLLIAISTSGLVSNHVNSLSLFPSIEKEQQLAQAMDKINDKFGASTIHSAAYFGAEHSAPDRIPFGKPRFEILND